MTCWWTARELVRSVWHHRAQGSQLSGDMEQSLLPPNFPSKPRHEDARSCEKKEKLLVTIEVTM